jgi:hypothetical protein
MHAENTLSSVGLSWCLVLLSFKIKAKTSHKLTKMHFFPMENGDINIFLKEISEIISIKAHTCTTWHLLYLTAHQNQHLLFIVLPSSSGITGNLDCFL